MATGTIVNLPVESETPKQLNGLLNSGSSITLTCSTFVGVFGYNASACSIYLCRSNFIIPLVNQGSTISITQSNGVYTITNTTASYGIRYMILYK